MRILFLSPWLPTPPVNGSKIRIYHLLKALSTSHAVTLASFVRQGEAIDLPMSEAMCEEVRTVPYREFRPHGWRARLALFSPQPRSVVDTFTPIMAQAVNDLIDNVDFIIACETVTARYLPRNLTIPCILDDLELMAGRDAIQDSYGWKRVRHWLTWEKSKRYVRRLLHRFNAVTVVSGIEKFILREVAPDFKYVRVIPNGVDTEYNRLGLVNPQPDKLVYSGALTYCANYDAVQYFLAQIFPLINQQHSRTYLHITGSTQGVDLTGLRIVEQVSLTGHVEDIRPEIASAWACVVPLRQGSGTRLKILEAMALGTPVVSTSKGAEGLDVTHEQNILIADDPSDFAHQVLRLIKNPDLRCRLAANGRMLVEQHYSWEMICKDFLNLIEEMAGLEKKADA